MSDSLWLHGLQHTRLPCPSLFPRVCSLMSTESIMPSNHLTSVAPFSSCPHSLPAPGSFPLNQLFASGGQSFGASASVPVLSMNIQGSFILGWLVWSLCSPKDPQESFPAPQFKGINFLALCLRYGPTVTSVHDYWKNRSFECYRLLSFPVPKLRLLILFAQCCFHYLSTTYPDGWSRTPP